MIFQFKCPACQATYSVDSAHVGKKAQCKSCGQRLEIPTSQKLHTMLGVADQQTSTPAIDKNEPATPPLPPMSAPTKPVVANQAAIMLVVSVIGLILLVAVLVIAFLSAKDRASDGGLVQGKSSRQETSNEAVRTKPTSSAALKSPAKSSLPTLHVPIIVDKPLEYLPKVNLEPVSDERLYRQLVKSACMIQVGDRFGSGVLINAELHLIVTNAHVIDDQDSCLVVFPKFNRAGELLSDASHYQRNREELAFRGSVVAIDKNRDLAMVRADRVPKSSKPIAFAPQYAMPGAKVFSIGGSGAKEGLMWRLTVGTVRGRSQRTTVLEAGRTVDCLVLETDSPINRGDSGGLTANDRGELVGVVSYTASDERQVSGHIDIVEVRKFVTDKTPK